jgi:TrmH family RNA methyltransferase
VSARVVSITSRDNPLLVRLRRLLAQPDAYRKIGAVWLEGESLCRSWLAHRPDGPLPRASAGPGAQGPARTVPGGPSAEPVAGTPARALIGASAWGDPKLARLAAQAGAVTVLPDALMAELSTLESAPGLGYVIGWPGAGSVRAGAPTVVLDRLQDAGNVGTILRSAAAFGYTQVVALKGTAALWSPKVLRAAMGAHFALDLVEGAEDGVLDQVGVPLFATSSHAPEPIHRVALPWPCGWVFGHEGQGVAPALTERCAATLRIPQPGGEESLNVAVAAALCMYESARPRLPP